MPQPVDHVSRPVGSQASPAARAPRSCGTPAGRSRGRRPVRGVEGDHRGVLDLARLSSLDEAVDVRWARRWPVPHRAGCARRAGDPGRSSMMEGTSPTRSRSLPPEILAEMEQSRWWTGSRSSTADEPSARRTVAGHLADRVAAPPSPPLIPALVRDVGAGRGAWRRTRSSPRWSSGRSRASRTSPVRGSWSSARHRAIDLIRARSRHRDAKYAVGGSTAIAG